MGVNDTPLSQRERDELRETVTTGAVRMRRIRARRIGLLSGAAAVVLVAGVVTGVVIGTMTPATPPVMTTSPSPTPTRTPSATPTTMPTRTPAVAYGGDCGRVLSAQDLALELGQSARPYNTDVAFSTSESDQARLLGGVICTWMDDAIDMLKVNVLDAAVVPGDLRERYSSIQCGTVRTSCELGRVVGDLWIGVGATPRIPEQWKSPTDDEKAVETARLSELIDRIAVGASSETAVAVPRGSDWWSTPDCATMAGAVEPVIGLSLASGYRPGTGQTEGEGMTWDIQRSNGLESSCAFYSPSAESRRMRIEVRVQPGAGMPAPTLIQRDDVKAVQVADADQAWDQVNIDTPYRLEILAVRGPNRVVVTYVSDDPAPRGSDEVVAAVLGTLR